MRTAVLGTMFIAFGCAAPISDDGDEPASPDETLRAQLARGATFGIETVDATVRATFHRADGPDEAVIALDVLAGSIDAWAYTDTVSLSAAFDLAPIPLPSDLQPGNLSLVDVHVAFDASCAADWSTRAATCDASGDAVVSWSLASGDGVHPLGDLVIDDVALSVQLTEDGVALDAAAPGSQWSWAGVFELGDVAVAVTATRE